MSLNKTNFPSPDKNKAANPARCLSRNKEHASNSQDLTSDCWQVTKMTTAVVTHSMARRPLILSHNCVRGSVSCRPGLPVKQSPHLDSLGLSPPPSLTSARHSPALTVLQTTRTSTAGAGALDPHSKLNTLLQHVREVNRLDPYCLQLLCCLIERCYQTEPILPAVLLGMGRCYQTEETLAQHLLMYKGYYQNWHICNLHGTIKWLSKYLWEQRHVRQSQQVIFRCQGITLKFDQFAIALPTTKNHKAALSLLHNGTATTPST